MRLSIVRLLGGLAAVITALTFAVPAVAQDWLSDRARAQGPGIRVGDFELHPGIGIEAGYDSNVFFSDGSATSAPIVSSGILRVTPHLLFSTIGAQREAEGEARDSANASPPTVQFSGGLSASYYAFFADEARNNLSFDGNLNLVILPERPFTVTIHERFSRVIRPFTEQRGVGTGDGRLDFGRNENDAGVNFSFGTPGRVLSANLGYSLIYNFFDGDEFKFADSLSHRFNGGASFRFLPQTAFIYDIEGVYRTFPSAGDSLASALLSDGFTVRTRVGINGAFTNRLSLSALVGYAAGWFDVQDDFESVVAQLELRWQASASARFALGYDRNFTPSYIGNFMRVDRGYVNFQLMIGGSFLVGAEASLGLLDFGTPIAPDGTLLGNGERSDIRLSTSLFAEYRLTNWLGLNGTLRYTGDFTDYAYSIMDMPGSTIIDPAGYSKVEAWFGVRAFY